MPLEAIKRKETLLILNRYDKEGFILIPSLFRKHFEGKKVKLLFDKESNLIALQPSNEESDYPTSRWRVWCTNFFKEYNIPSQKVEATWIEGRNYLIAKIRRA